MMDISSYRVVVEDDPDNEGFYSIFTNAADTINVEIAGKIGERAVAVRIAQLWNEALPMEWVPMEWIETPLDKENKT